MRPAKARPKQFQEFHLGNYLSLGIIVQHGEPFIKEIGRFCEPHYPIIAYGLFIVNSLQAIPFLWSLLGLE